jgi:hypothetical protein
MSFIKAAREWLEVDKDSYYYDEYESGLDHDDVCSLSEFARYFYNKGRAAAEAELKRNPKFRD